MRELINMVVVLTGISLASGGLLASSTASAAAQAFVEHIVSPAARQRFQAAGFEAP
jgi:ABC-type Fe3+ transport system substrate-binding protein